MQMSSYGLKTSSGCFLLAAAAAACVGFSAERGSQTTEADCTLRMPTPSGRGQPQGGGLCPEVRRFLWGRGLAEVRACNRDTKRVCERGRRNVRSQLKKKKVVSPDTSDIEWRANWSLLLFSWGKKVSTTDVFFFFLSVMRTCLYYTYAYVIFNWAVCFLPVIFSFFCLSFHSFFLPNNIRQRDCRRKLGYIYINVNTDDT